jgi:protein subunit release factor B
LALSEAERQAAMAALRKPDAALEADCELEFFIGGGPGGQHRNKTASAVRLHHPATGLTVLATERRSQAQNRAVALARLRERLASRAARPKERRKTAPSRSQKAQRLETKRRKSLKKASRRMPVDR